ncbi:MAG: hypothetical protein QOF39_1970, partial [Frankiales bacterium]|nr:hypothetical protein [Frankiales bacterium]
MWYKRLVLHKPSMKGHEMPHLLH